MRRADRGFILATTLLVMTVLTVMLAAAFVMISAEFRTTNGSYGSTRALNVAQAGMETYFAQSHNLSSGYDSTNYTFKGGYARVVARKLRDSTGTSKALWAVYSAGVDTTNRTNAGSAGGIRVVARLAKLNPGQLPARAAMVAANRVNLQVGNGVNPIDGRNHPETFCPSMSQRDTIGLTIGPATDYSNGNGSVPYNGIEFLGTENVVIDSTYIDWAKLVAGQFTPDHVNQLPPANNTDFSIYYYPDSTGTVQIPSGRRQGVLITQGGVQMLSGSEWDGIIVAGENLDANGNFPFTIYGMVITGLNTSRGHNVQPNLVRRGNVRLIKWDYCYATASISSFSVLTPVQGSTTDSWKTW